MWCCFIFDIKIFNFNYQAFGDIYDNIQSVMCVQGSILVNIPIIYFKAVNILIK